MKRFPGLYLLFILLSFMVFISGCATRDFTPEMMTDSTIVYRSCDSVRINAQIKLYRNLYNSDDLPDNLTNFRLKNNVNLIARIYLKNTDKYIGENLMFHIDWIDNQGESFYLKRIDLTPEKKENEFISAISLDTSGRAAGNYSIKVYLFRELIAEKNFTLEKAYPLFPLAEIENLKHNLILYRKYNKKKEKYYGAKGPYKQVENAWLRAKLELPNINKFKEYDFDFKFEWRDPDGNPFYTKELNIPPGKKVKSLKTAIPISEDKRERGKYTLNMFLNDSLLETKNFELIPEFPDYSPEVIKKIKPGLSLYRKKSKKTGKLIGEGDSFQIKKGRKVRADIRFSNLKKIKDPQPEGKIIWKNPRGKTIYTQTFKLPSKSDKKLITSELSQSKGKYKPGKYKIEVYIFREKVAVKEFTLYK